MNENNTKKFAEERRRQQSNQARARETLKKQHETQLKLLLRSREMVRHHATIDHVQLSELSFADGLLCCTGTGSALAQFPGVETHRQTGDGHLSARGHWREVAAWCRIHAHRI